MSERKVLNKYYPPDFEPSKIPRLKLGKNRQYTVRLMAPFNMRCSTCGEYIYKGKKFNAKKEDVGNENYLGIQIYRFYIKCTRCLQEISFKTDPKSTDYELEAGATRNFMALDLAEKQTKREEVEQKEDDSKNPMKLLEYRTEKSCQEMEILESLEELKELNQRLHTVDYETLLMQYQPESKEKREAREEREDDEFIKSIKFRNTSSKKIIAEEIIEDILDDGPCVKTSRIEVEAPTNKNVSWNRSIGVFSRKSALSNLVKLKNSDAVSMDISSKLFPTTKAKSRKKDSSKEDSKSLGLKDDTKPAASGYSIDNLSS